MLSGGSGKRLWPLSNDIRSKQFLKIFLKEDGTKESMVQRMYRMIKEVDPESAITIATSEKQIPQIKAQLGNKVDISVEPTYPSEKYGYIIPFSDDRVAEVKEFKEKPASDVAKKYIEQGALWNGGVFAFRLSYILGIAQSLFGTDNYDKLFANYEALQKTSFDYAVAQFVKVVVSDF